MPEAHVVCKLCDNQGDKQLHNVTQEVGSQRVGASLVQGGGVKT
jgi:hypothetical protein